MSLSSRLRSAYKAFAADRPMAKAITLDGPPTAPVGPTGARAKVDAGGARAPGRRRRRVAPLPIDRTRWLRADIEAAEHIANSGQLQRAAQIAQWVREDLIVGGLFSTRCAVVRLPREWRGDAEAILWLQGAGADTGCFDRIFPPNELEELAIDRLNLGVGIAMFIQPEGAAYPTLVRLDPQYLRYLPGEDRWQYQGYGHVYDVTPGDGTWVLHAAGAIDPWRRGLWSALGYDQVSKDGAGLARDAFIWKFGNPFVMAIAPTGSSEDQKARFWSGVSDWVMGFAGITPGWDAKLIEAKGEGSKVFADAEALRERRAMIAIAGQVVTVTGGVGFANAEIFETIASHHVARTGQDLAQTLNEQALPRVVEWAIQACKLTANCGKVTLAYDTTPPQARKAEADALKAVADSVVAMKAAGFEVDLDEVQARYRVPAKKKAAPVLALVEPVAEAEPPPEEIQGPASIADQMTAHGMQACEHGRPNRCPICGVERAREVVPGIDGAPATYRMGSWRMIEDSITPAEAA